MKKRNIVLYLSLFSIILSSDLLALDTVSVKYFPTSVGDIFLYDFSSNSAAYSIRSMITKDTILNTHRYFYCMNFYSMQNGWYRADSNTGTLYQYTQNTGCRIYGNDVFRDSLAMRNGTFDFCGLNTLCSYQPNVQLFGVQTNKLSFSWGIGGSSGGRTYAYSFGFYHIGGTNGINSFSVTLRGCVLNGVVFGDTSYNVTGITFTEGELVKNYALFHNYPNPFNPVTNIKFDIPKKSNVKISIFDVLGKEISVLVNEELSPGTFEVNWDASNFPSGVYFYKIETGDYSESKKMVLIK